MNDSKRLVGKIGLVGISNIIGRITMILLVPILTKSLTVDDYGLWVIIVATIGLAPSLINLSLPSALIRYLPSAKDRESKQEVFYSMMLVILITSGLATIVLFALAGPISASLLKSELIVAQLLALIIFFNCIFSLAVSFFNGILKIRKYSLIVILKNVLNLLFIGIFIGEGHGITGAVIGLAISDGLVVLLAVGMVVMEIGIKLPSFSKVREYLGFSLPMVPSDLSSWVVRSSDRYLIGLMLGAAFVGFYSPAYTLGDVIVMYTVPISIILYPTLSKYYDEKRLDSLERTLSHSIKYYLALSIPTLFGLSFLSFPLLNILTTYEIAINGYYITPIVCLGCLFWGMFVLLSKVIMVAKKTRIIGAIWIIAAIVNFGLNLVLIPVIGIIGGAITTLLAFGLASVVVFHYARKEIVIELNVNFVAKSVLASLVMSLILLLWQTTDLLMVLIEIIMCAVVYFAVLFALKGFSKKEISFFMSFIPGHQ